MQVKSFYDTIKETYLITKSIFAFQHANKKKHQAITDSG